MDKHTQITALKRMNEELIGAWKSLLNLTPEIKELEIQAPATFKRVKKIMENAEKGMK